MGARYLIDTNAAIDFLGGLLPEIAMSRLESWILNGECCMSIINRIELYSIVMPPSSLLAVNNLVAALPILALSDDVADAAIQIRQASKLKLPDAIIAGTCRVFNLSIISRNVSDFSKIPDLNVVNPHLLIAT